MFRSEAIEHATAKLEGNVIVPPRVGWEVLSAFMIVIVLLGAVFLVTGTYARSENVTGTLVPSLGISHVLPSRAGVILDVAVKEGQLVKAGQPLLEIGNEEATRRGANATDRLVSFLEEQEDNLDLQMELIQLKGESERNGLNSEIAGLRNERAELEDQIARQITIVAKAQEEYERIQDLVSKGFVTRRESDVREEAVLAKSQDLQSLKRQASALRSKITQAGISMAKQSIEMQADLARLKATEAELGKSRAEVESRRGYMTVAAVNGKVTSVDARRGQIADPSRTAMMIIPDGSHLEAELHVPTRAAGFLRLGQEVRLQIDAFPFQRFGTIPARISRVPNAATSLARMQDGAQNNEPIYVVSARVGSDAAAKWNRKLGLQPGMTLRASIITERRTLLEWLIEPLLSVRGRL
jgi:membrane fusion protein